MHPGRCGAALLVCIVICTASREVLSQQFNSHSNDEQHPYKGSTHVRGLNQQQRNGAAERKLLDEAAPDPSQDFPDGYVALCVIVKNQAADLQEWLQYHRFIGVEKVYLYDNNSTRPLACTIRNHLQSGFVQYSYIAGTHKHSRVHGFATTPQGQAYNDCIQQYRRKHRWLGFIDVDEFVILHDSSDIMDSSTATVSDQQESTGASYAANTKPDIRRLLQAYKGFGALALNWVMFGSNGHLQRPRGGVLINYHECMPLEHNVHTHVKVFANTAHVASMGGTPHNVMFNKPDIFTVNELRQKVVGPFFPPPSHKRASVYHYATKSKREFLLKMKRGAGDGTRKSKAFFTSTNEQATATCVAGMRLAPVCCSDLLNKELSSEEMASLLDETLQLSKGAVDAGSAHQMAQSV